MPNYLYLPFVEMFPENNCADHPCAVIGAAG